MSDEKPNECCRDDANLVAEPYGDDPALTLRRCQVCGCRHFELDAETARLGLVPAALG